MIISNIEKSTLTRCAIFGAAEQKTGIDCNIDAHIKLWQSFSVSHRVSWYVDRVVSIWQKDIGI